MRWRGFCCELSACSLRTNGWSRRIPVALRTFRRPLTSRGSRVCPAMFTVCRHSMSRAKRLWVAPMALVVFTLVHVPNSLSAPAAKLGPSEILGHISQFGATRMTFLVTGSEQALAAARASSDDHVGTATSLDYIGAVAVYLPFSTASRLSRRADVNQVWYIDRELAPVYVRVLQGLERLKNEQQGTPFIANVSLGPPGSVMPLASHPEEPMNAATKQVADAGGIITVAIGNYYDGSNPGVVNPWCEPLWVICVGAASADATSIADFSARGEASRPRSWPTLVADGVDVVGPWPAHLAKSEDRRRRDASTPAFRDGIPKDQWDLYTVESGTSQANAQVSRAAAHILAFLFEQIESRHLKSGDPIISLTIPPDQFARVQAASPRLAGDVTGHSAAGIEIAYSLVEPWKLVRQLLIDTSIAIPGTSPAAAGAGFVSPKGIEAQFPTKAVTHPRVEAIKVLP